jgi:hypothetical protein
VGLRSVVLIVGVPLCVSGVGRCPSTRCDSGYVGGLPLVGGLVMSSKKSGLGLAH